MKEGKMRTEAQRKEK